MVGAFDKNLHEGYIWTGHRAVLSFILHKSIFLHFVHNGKIFYGKYISSDNKKKYIDDDGSGVFPKQFKISKDLFKLILCSKTLLYKRYKNMSEIFRNKMNGNRLCLYKWFTIS